MALEPEALTAEGSHQTWGLDRDAGVWRLDVFREPSDGDTWICRRDASIRFSRGEHIEWSEEGIPYARPELTLLFKAKHARPKDDLDLHAVLEVLPAARRRYLADLLVDRPSRPSLAERGPRRVERVEPARRTAGAREEDRRSRMTTSTPEGESPSELIDRRIIELGDWRGETLGRVRALIKKADPDVVEAWKWRGVPVWEHDGIICTGETYKSVVKLTFAKGASLEDPAGLFNSSLEGNTRRAIDIHEDERIDEKALVALIKAAVALNTSSPKRRR